MYCRVPVVAVNSGGPRESIVHGKTGLLLPGTVEAFADGLDDLCFGKQSNLKVRLYWG